MPEIPSFHRSLAPFLSIFLINIVSCQSARCGVIVIKTEYGLTRENRERVTTMIDRVRVTGHRCCLPFLVAPSTFLVADGACLYRQTIYMLYDWTISGVYSTVRLVIGEIPSGGSHDKQVVNHKLRFWCIWCLESSHLESITRDVLTSVVMSNISPMISGD